MKNKTPYFVNFLLVTLTPILFYPFPLFPTLFSLLQNPPPRSGLYILREGAAWFCDPLSLTRAFDVRQVVVLSAEARATQQWLYHLGDSVSPLPAAVSIHGSLVMGEAL